MAFQSTADLSVSARVRARPGLVPTNGDEMEHLVWPYRIAVPFLYAIGAYAAVKRLGYRLLFGRKARPNTNVWFVDGISVSSRAVRDGAARFEALDVVYNFQRGVGNNAAVRAIDSYWLHIRNAAAVRNRLRVLKRELRVSIMNQRKRIQDARPVRILSVAAGSAQGVIEQAAALRSEGIAVEAVLVDMSRNALAYARELAERHGVSDIVRTVRAKVVENDDTIANFDDHIGDFVPDIVEMAGLIDYLKDGTIEALFAKIRGLLPIGGQLLTCHIHPNHESFFLLVVVNWWMRYRSKEQLSELLACGGFPTHALHPEPYGIHSIAVAERTI